MLMCLGFAMQAQTNVVLSGKITDTTQTPVSSAIIAVEGTAMGTYSDDNGSYHLQVPEGRHTFTISALDYETKKITLQVKAGTKADFVLSKLAVDLSSVEVFGKTKQQQLREGSFTVNSIDVKIQANSLNNLNDLIARSSGVKLREDGGLGSDFGLSINGLSGNAIRYFVDGVPLSTVGNEVSLSNLPVTIVDRIDIYKGVVPAELGSDALGGAINIITKKDRRNYLDVSYGFGSFHTHKFDLNARYLDKKTGLFFQPSLGVNYSKNDYKMKNVEVPDDDREGFKTIDTKRFHDDYLSIIGQLTVGLEHKSWADLLSFTTSYSYVNSELQTGSVQNKVYGMAEREGKAYSIGAQYRKKSIILDGLSAEFSVSHTWDHAIVTDTAFRKYDWTGNYIPASRNEITGRDRSIRHIKRPLTIGRANLCYLLNDNHAFNINYLLHRVVNDRTDEFDTEFVPSKDIFNKHIIGLSYNQNLWDDRWSNTFFVKDYISHLTVKQQDLSWITGSDEIPSSSTSNNWGYGLSTRFRFMEWLALKASAERSVRLPLAREYMGNGTTIYPNFLLNPENSRNFNLGLFGTIHPAPRHSLFYETGLFYRGVEDYIRLVVTEAEGTGQYQNVKDVTVSGIEGEIRYEYDNRFQLIANVSYVDEKSKSKYLSNGKPDVTYNNRIPNKPWLYSNAELNWRLKNVFGQKHNQLKASWYYQYVHWFYLTWKGYGSPASKSKIPTQSVHHASLTYSLDNEKYTISLECNNLFDKLVYDNYMMQKPGRSFFCKFSVFIH